MRGGGDEDEAGCPARVGERKGGGDSAAEGVSDNDGVLHAQFVHQRGDGVGLTEGGFVGSTAARPAMARAVEKQHLGTAFEKRTERKHLVLEVAARAVDEDQRRQVAVGRAGDVHIVHPGSGDRHEFTCRGIAALDQPRADAADAGQAEKQGEHKRDECRDEIHVGEITVRIAKKLRWGGATGGG